MAARAEKLPGQYDNHDQIDRQLGLYDEASTLFAETLDGNMRTEFLLRFDGEELYSHDGQALKSVFQDSINAAEKLAESQPNFLFELRRRQIELEEYQDMLALARSGKHNTMVVVSDFPPELMTAKESMGGYNKSRQQTMLRVITRQAGGSLRMISQSLDRSNRPALEAIYAHFGLKPNDGELLGQRIFTEIAQEEQVYLDDFLTGLYDKSLTDQYGGHWYAGRSSGDTDNTYDFVRRQSDLLHYYVQSRLDNSDWVEKLDYNVAATFAKRFKRYSELKYDYQFNPSGLPHNLMAEVANDGAKAQAQGLSFNSCGTTLGPSESDLQKAGYGNKTNEASSYKFDKKMYCVVCQVPPKETEKPKMCGPCGICQKCDLKLSSHPKVTVI
ncbi:MAG: hypothetical protein ACREF5_01810 [Candidatus Saccharimonadales bacterium]